jgi:hypothetical protein
MAYSEQLGMNRHDGGRSGRTSARYACTSAISALVPRLGSSALPRGSKLQGLLEFGGRLGIREIVRAGFGDDDDVVGAVAFAASAAKDLPHDSLYAIASDRVADARAHRDAEPRRATVRRLAHDDEVGRVTAAPAALHGEEFPATAKPCCLWKALVPLHPFTPAAWLGCSR